MTRKPPKKCQVPELWWSLKYNLPLIFYPSGVIEVFTSHENYSGWSSSMEPSPGMYREWSFRNRYEFICELK